LEAVSGLGRSFFFAGARSVLVSNWPVHSAATTSLMSRLFIAIANNPEISRSQNLRLTQLQMIDKLGYEENGHLVFSYAHPIFWAPFTLVGDGG
jgi:CHAT domain-containing protein